MKDKYEKYFPVLSGIGASSIFGFSFLFTKIGLVSVNNEPFDLISSRFTIAAILLLVLKLTGIIKLNYRGKNIKLLLLLSLFQPVLYFIFETYGIKLTSSSETGTMIALIPVIVTVLASIFLKEKTNIKQVLFILISLSGVLVINLPKFQGKGSLLGMLLLLLTVISAAFYSIISRKLSQTFSPLESTFVMMWLGAIVFNSISIVRHLLNNNINTYFTPFKNPTFLISVVYLGVLSSVVAFFLLNYTYSKLKASEASSFANIATVVSIFAGIIILKESFDLYQGIGIFLILFGVWGTNRFGIKGRAIDN